MAFREKIPAVDPNSQENFYDNCASVVLGRLTTVSAELPAILEKIMVNLKKISTRGHHRMTTPEELCTGTKGLETVMEGFPVYH